MKTAFEVHARVHRSRYITQKPLQKVEMRHKFIQTTFLCHMANYKSQIFSFSLHLHGDMESHAKEK